MKNLFSKTKCFLLVCSACGEAHLTMPVGLLPFVVSEVSPALLPPAPLCTHWSTSCASPALHQPQPPVKHISGLCGCILTEAIKPAQAAAHQEAAISESCSAPCTTGAQSCSRLMPCSSSHSPSHPHQGLCCQPRAR